MRALLTFVSLSAICFAGKPSIPSDADSLRRNAVYAQYRSYRKHFPDVLDITPFHLNEMLKDGRQVVLVDVREKKEIKVSTIPEAITKKEFERRRGEFRGRLIVAYCTIGYRSGKYAEILGGEGFSVRNLAGGILLWAHQVGTLSHNGKPTRRLHTYGKRWDLAPRSFESVQ